MEIKEGNLDFEKILGLIKKEEPFSFSRWGDGEWNCIFEPNDNRGNSDGHKYFNSLSVALKNVLISKPKYYLGMQGFAMRLRGDQIKHFLSANGLEDLTWEQADIFHKESIHNKFHQFFDVIKDKVTILVGPQYLLKANFNWKNFVVIPEKDCWLGKYEIIKQIKEIIKSKENKNIVVLFCASMPANVMIDELYNWNPNYSYLDMGSVFDPYLGVSKRGYHKNIIAREQENGKIL